MAPHPDRKHLSLPRLAHQGQKSPVFVTPFISHTFQYSPAHTPFSPTADNINQCLISA